MKLSVASFPGTPFVCLLLLLLQERESGSEASLLPRPSLPQYLHVLEVHMRRSASCSRNMIA